MNSIARSGTAPGTSIKTAQAPDKFNKRGNALFYADISGFTRLVSIFSKKGKEGLEEIANIVNILYGTFIQASQRHGGFFINAAGDSVLISLPSDISSVQAVNEVRRTLKKKMKKYETVFPDGKISIKTAFVSGEFNYSPYFWKDNYFAVVSGKSKEILASFDLKDDESVFYPCKPFVGHRHISTIPDQITDYTVIKDPEHRVVASMMMQVPLNSELDFFDFTKNTDSIVSQYDGEISDIDCVSREGFKMLILFGHRTDNPAVFEDILACAESIIVSGIPELEKARIGISAGYAYTGTLDAGDKSKFMAISDDINLSERLTRKASQGEVLFSEKFKNLLPSKVKCSKSKDDNLPKYPGKVGYYRFKKIESPSYFFTGRIKELKTMRKLLDKGIRTIQVTGEQGIGKSALLNHLRKELVENFNVFYITKRRDDAPLFISEEAFQAIGYRVESAEFFSLPQSVRTDILKDKVINVLKNKSPFALLIDDAELKSFDFIILRGLENILQGTKSLMILSSRSTLPFKHYSEIKLSPLNLKSTENLLENELGSNQIGKSLLQYVNHASRGNPLFSIMISKYLDHFGYLNKHDSKTELAREPKRIPENLAFVSMARFNSMKAEMKNVLKMSSIAGDSFRPDMMKDLTGNQETFLYLSQAAAQGILEFRGNLFSFRQSFFKDVLYDSVISKQKKEIHLKIAEILCSDKYSVWAEPGDIAHHLHMAGKKDEALSFYMKAVKSALYKKKSEEALRLIGRAESIAERESEIYELIRQKAESHSIQGDYTKQAFYIEKCISWAKKNRDKPLLAVLYTSLGFSEYLKSNFKKSVYYFKKALSYSSKESIDDACMHISNVYWRLGKIEMAEKYLDSIDASGDKLKCSKLYPDYLHKRGLLAYAKNDLNKALEYFTEAQKLDTGDFFREFLLNDIAETHFFIGNTDKALNYIKKSLKYSQKIGYIWSISYSTLNYSIFLAEKGLYKKAVYYIDRCIKLSDVVYPQINTVAKINKFLILLKFSDDFDGKKLFSDIKKTIHYIENPNIKLFADYAWAKYLRKSGELKKFRITTASLIKRARLFPPVKGNITGIYINCEDIENLAEENQKTG